MQRIIFETTPQQLHSAAENVIANSKNTLDSVAAAPASFESTLVPFARMENELIDTNNVLPFYQYVSADADLRAASEKVSEDLSSFQIEASKRPDVYEKIKQVYNSGTELDPQDQRYLEKIYRELRRAGLDLSAQDREKLTQLEKELSQATIKYQANLAGDNSFRLFTKDQLKGVQSLEQFEEQDGKYKMTFKITDYTTVMRWCSVEETRKETFVGYANRCPENEVLFNRALTLRREIAALLGYPSAAAHILDIRMAHDPETVKAFLNDLVERSAPIAAKESEEFLTIKQELDPEATTVYAWDSMFLQNKVVERKYKIDEEKVSQYFELNHTIRGMFDIFSKLMDLEFRSVDLKPEEKWHPEVECFGIYQEGDLKGELYLDNHPRPNKYGHFANFALRQGHIDEGVKHLPSSALVCNFPRPTGERPALLKHDDVVTFFHELGHGIHATLGLTRYARFSGTNNQLDFVEAPSQLLENWTWDKDQLRSLAKHYKTGEPMPEDLLDQLVASRNANQGTFLNGQLFYGLFDFKMHTDPNPDPLAEWQQIRDDVIKMPSTETLRGYNQFGHLMGGYECGYYGYLWSLVYSADIWATLFETDPLNASAGAKYRDGILAKGYSEDAADLLCKLLCRAPNSDAFLKKLGLTA